MAEKLIFPIGFDLEAAVKEAQSKGDKAIKDLQKTFSRQPLVFKAETKGFAELGQDIETLKTRLKEIKTQWEKMPTAAKFDLDSEGRIKQLTAEGKSLWDELLRITTALQGVGQSIMQFANQSSKALQEETRFAEQMRDAEIRRYNEASRAKLKEQEDDEKRYQKWLAYKEKEVQKEQETAQRKQNARERAANAARKAQREEEVEAYKVNAALKAQENILQNLTAKLNIYQQRIQGQQVGTEAWNKTALEIRRITEELQKANQQMQDFQQKSFQGLSDSLTKGKVQALTQFREQLRQIDADFNRLNQTGAAFNAKGSLTPAANDILRQREAIIKQINQMLTTAADAQIRREKEINRIVEQRKAKADAIAAKRKAEQAAIQGNIAKMKEERRILNQQESSIANITAKLQIQQQRLQSAKFGSGAFDKAVKEVERLTKKLDDAKRKIDELTGKTQSGSNTQTSAINKTTEAIKNQDGYVSRLIKRLAVYAGFSAVSNFLTNVREVTAQFELQKVSLGAIIQDQARANQLFAEIKNFALKSPVKILDLTKYTKQLAAYKIGTDELFDTTKRLADVSVGLGVDMQRLILFYGQVRAAGYLRASEVRQATEAGIPLVEELARKLSEANGELVRASDVMDMISKRQISFEQVKEVFEDMTSAGGMFYNMQEKQGNTLYGMWQKLGDAAAMMYDEIGNTDSVNTAMRMTIDTLRYVMLHWKQTGIIIGGVSAYLIANVIATKNATIATAAATTTNKLHVASLQQKLGALRLEQMNLKSTAIFQRLHTATTIAAIKAQIAAATSTNVFSKALYGLKAALLSNPLTALAVALTTIIGLFMTTESELDKLESKINEIESRYATQATEMRSRFVELADTAINAADGSKVQKDALDELNRTYGSIIPQELRTIENLRAMGDGYSKLLPLIDEYNAKKKGEEKETAIKGAYDAAIAENLDDFKDMLNAFGATREMQVKIEQQIRDNVAAGMDAITATNKAYEAFADELSNLNAMGNLINITSGDKMLDSWGVMFRSLKFDHLDFQYDFARSLIAQNEALEKNRKATESQVAELNKYAAAVSRVGNIVQNETGNRGVLEIMTRFNVKDEKKVVEAIERLKKKEIGKIDISLFHKDEIERLTEAMNKEIQEASRLITSGGEMITLSEDNPLVKERVAAIREKYKAEFAKLGSEGAVTLNDILGMEDSEDSVTQMMQLNNDKINLMIEQIKEILSTGGVEINDEWFNIVSKLDPKDLTEHSVIRFEDMMTQIKATVNDPMLLAALEDLQKNYELLAPSDAVMQAAYMKIFKFAAATQPSTQAIKTALKGSEENWEDYYKRIKTVTENSSQKVKELTAEIQDLLANTAYMETEIGKAFLKLKYGELDDAKRDEAFNKMVQGWAKTHVYTPKKTHKTGGGGTQSDPRLNNLKEEISLTKKLYDEYNKLEKQIGAVKAAEKIKEFYENTIKTLEARAKAYGFTFKLPFTDADLKSNLDEFIKIMKGYQNLKTKKGKPIYPNIGRDIDEAVAMLGDIDVNSLKNALDKKLKELADKISRTKTVREFYNKILDQTGDVNIAANLTMSIYGTPGEDLNKQIKQQVEALVSGTSAQLDVRIFRTDNSLDPKRLRDFAEANKDLLGNTYKELIKIADDAEKSFTNTIEGWMKAVEKAKTYSDKLLDLSRTTSSSIEQIWVESRRTQQDLARLLAIEEPTEEQQKRIESLRQMLVMYMDLVEGFKNKQAKEETALAYEAFKDSPMYVQMFEDLDNASTAMLTAMKKRIEEVKVAWKNLTPAQLKELQSRLNEIDKQLVQRNPFKGLIKGLKEYRRLRKEGDSLGSKSREEADQKLIDAQQKRIDAELAYKKLLKEEEALKGQVNAAKISVDVASDEDRDAAQEDYNKLLEQEKALREKINEAKNEYDKAADKERKAAQAAEEWKEISDRISIANEKIDEYQSKINEALDGVRKMLVAFGVGDEDLQLFDDIVSSLNEIVDAGQQAATSVAAFMSGDIFTGITSGISAIGGLISGFTNLIYAGRIHKANREIKKQQELLEQLEYTYGRLQKVSDKLFGKDYINNFEQQQKNLQAQAEAYQKQLEAEKSKGKKADKEKIKEYEEAWRDTMDEIADMQSQLIEKFTGTSKTDVAKQMAQSWIEARASMSDTFAAIKEDYSEMIKNMIVEGAAARVIENALSQMWEQMDAMLQKNDINGAIDALVGGMDDALNAANNGMEVLWKALEARGYDMKQLIGDVDSGYTGIKREVAGATSEEMNANTAALNTQNYYVSHLPGIAANVALIAQHIANGNTSATTATTAAGWTDWQQQAMDQYMAIQRNTADTVVECRRAATAAEEAVTQLRRVIRPKSGTSSFGIQVYM